MPAQPVINPDEQSEDDSPEALDPKAEYRALLEKVKSREEAFKKGWWKDAETARKLYDGSSSQASDEDRAYNILYSNTEVLLPSLYSATPKPDIRARYLPEAAKLSPVTTALERYLTILSDPGTPGFESFDDALSETVLSSLVPGMGYSRLRYYPKRANPLAIESGFYKTLLWGKARKWSKTPWVAFRHELTPAEFYAQFAIPEEDENKLSLLDDPSDDYSEKSSSPTPKGTIVYEIWVKASKKIIFLSEDWEDLLCREDPDVLKLAGFYPTPGPLLFTKQPGDLTPVPLFQYYRNQAQELNRITIRLNKVISAIRVRGAYNGLLGPDMEKLLANGEMENALIPASEAALLAAQGGGFERHIWFLPIEKLVQVAATLYQARESIKAVIYEITGLSDIIRGSSVASETATAQDLKNKWGTIRLRRMQTLVANYVRDIYRLASDAAPTILTPEQWKSITSLPFPTRKEQAAARQQIQMAQQAYAQAAQMAQTQNQPPPPQPPIPPPVQAQAQGPAWEDILSQISSDSSRVFLINVQDSSTIDLDTAADKDDVTKFMASLGQILPGLGQFAALGPSGLEASKAILSGVCTRYKFGLDMLPAIQGLEAPPPPQGPSPEEEKAKEQAAQAAQQQQAAAQAQQASMQKQLSQLKDVEMQLREQKLALDTQAGQLQLQQAALDLAKKELAAQTQVATISASADKKVLLAARETSALKQQLQGKAQVDEVKALIAATPPLPTASPAPDLTFLEKPLQDLADSVKTAQQKPKRIYKDPSGAWVPEY